MAPSEEKDPAGVSLHFVAPRSSLYLPAAHNVHVEAGPSENLPGGQGLHELMVSVTLPLGQAVQLTCPELLHEPTAQAVHTELPVPLANLPLSHPVQVVSARAGAYLPAPQAKHSLLPVMAL